jgi:type IV secretory pathway VirB10-like protein
MQVLGCITMKNSLMVFLMMFSMNTFAEVNKWVDENNHVHYSDQSPPASAKTKKLRSASDTKRPADASNTTASNGPATPKTIAEREAELRKTQQAKKEAADKAVQNQANEEAKKDYCSQAQKSLKALQDGIRMVEIDANGERSYPDDEQRRQRIAKTQQDISRHCK